MVTFNAVMDGFLRYMNNNIYKGMNDWQEVIARIAIGRIASNPEGVKNALMNNGIVRTFGIMDSEGNVDIENLARELKTEIERKGKMCIEIPMLGRFTFHPDDVDSLYKEITGQNII